MAMSVKIAVLLALTLCSSLVCCPRSVCLFFFFFKTKKQRDAPSLRTGVDQLGHFLWQVLLCGVLQDSLPRGRRDALF